MVLLMVVLTVAVGFLLAERFARKHISPSEAVRTVTPRGDLSAGEKSTIQLFEVASQSVVHIRSLKLGTFSAQQRGTGTGFVWDEHGHIVTNEHVLAGSNRFLVTFADQTTVEAVKIGVAEHKDLALLKVDVDPESLRPIAIGESYNLQVGQHVFAIGSPFGLEQTLTTGVISGLGREIKSPTQRRISDVIQTDAAINPGNSGGPLLDSAGRLIGVNTQIVSASGASDGIGFAIPVDTLRRVVPQLILHGAVISPSLGAIYRDAKRFRGLPRSLTGVFIHQVIENGPADSSGLLPFRYGRNRLLFGDLITDLGEQEITSLDDLYLALEAHSPGDTVSVKVIRGLDTSRPQRLTFDVRLGAMLN